MPDYLETLSPAFRVELSALLDEAIKLDAANMGNIQVYDEQTETLHLISQHGFDDDFINYFKEVKARSSATCGRAIGIGAPIIISDIWRDTSSREFKNAAQAAGYRAVKSIPIIWNDKRLGVISTHFKEPKWTWNLNTLDAIIGALIPLLEKIRSEADSPGTPSA